MMNIFFNCILFGPNFNPTPFLNSPQLEIVDYHCIGDVAKAGRKKGEILNYGHICFESKGEDFDKFVKELHQVKDLVTESDCEQRVVYLYLEYQNQCNWEFNPTTLRYMSELNMILAVSCAMVEN